MDSALVGLVQGIVADAARKLPHVVATFFDNRGMEIALNRKDERLSSAGSNRGFVLSIFNGEHFDEFATDRLDKDHIAGFCRRALDSIVMRDTKHRLEPPAQGDASFRTAEQVDPDSIPLGEKLDLFRERRARLLRGKNVVNCAIRHSEELTTKTFVSVHGTINEEIRRISHSAVVYVSDGQDLKYDFLIRGGTGGMELIDVPDSAIDEIIDSANRLLHAPNITPGIYDVVGTPEITGLIAHEAFGHGVETDMYLKDRARSRDFLGEMIASPLVSIVDDPSLPAAYGSYFVDDEGRPAKPTYIIKDGRFVQGLTSTYSSAVLSLPATANGRRESYARKVYTRMSNTFFQPGTTSPEEIIASLDNGIYLTKGMSGMEDPKGWGIQVIVLYGKEIKNGRVTERVFSPLGITGYVPDLLKDVSMVGSDFKVDVGMCGKGHKEYVPVSSGGPHIRTKVRLG